MDITFNYNVFNVILGVFFLFFSVFFVLRKKTGLLIKILRSLTVFLSVLLILNPAIVIFDKEYRPGKVFYIIDSSIYMRAETARNSNISKLDYVRKYLVKNKIPAEKIYFAADKIYNYKDFDKIKKDSFYIDFENSVKNCESYSCDYDKLVYFTDGYSDFELLENMDIVFVGEENKYSEKFINNLKHPDMAFLHIPFNIYFDLAPQTEKFEIMENGKTVYSQKNLPENSLLHLKKSVKLSPSTIGKKDYRICATSKTEKQCIDFSINILRDKLRILYLSGTPNHHYYFLREYLKTRTNVDLVSFIILREPYDSLNIREEDFSLIPFPREEIFFKDIFHFDILILEEFNLQQMGIVQNYLESLKKFVENGGSLLLIGGDIMSNSLKNLKDENFMEILPSIPYSLFEGSIKEFDFSYHPISAALNYYIPPLKGIFSLSKLSSDSRSVVSFKINEIKYPFISEKEYKKGRVLMINSSSLWQWKLKGFELKDNHYFTNFYKNIFSWLDFTLNLGRVSYSIIKGDKFYVNSYVLDEDYKLLSDKDGVNLSGSISKGNFKIPLVFRYQSPGLYRAYFPPLDRWKYRFEVLSSFKNGKTEKYSEYFYVEKENSKKGYSKEKFEETLKKVGMEISSVASSGKGEVHLLNEYSLNKTLSMKKEIKKISKKILIAESVYFFAFMILVILSELILRRFKGEL